MVIVLVITGDRKYGKQPKAEKQLAEHIAQARRPCPFDQSSVLSAFVC